MTTYTKRDLRAADLLAAILFGLGVVMLAFAALPWFQSKPTVSAGDNLPLWIEGGVFAILGLALNLKLRELIRNRGKEPEQYPGVPD